MGRPGGKTKTKKMAETRRTREQLKTWTVPQLGRYLKDRGVAASKSFLCITAGSGSSSERKPAYR